MNLHKINFRTSFKETTMCAVCGKDDVTFQNHHIRPIKRRSHQKYKGYRGFDKLVAALGRKQIPMCPQCHQNIHRGKYNGMSLNDPYDVRLVAPEGLLLYNLGKTKKHKSREESKLNIKKTTQYYYQ